MKKLLLLVILLFFLSCTKKEPCRGVEKIQIMGHKNLSESDKVYMPYNGDETLVFVSNQGDTAILKGIGDLKEYERLRLIGSGYSCNEEHYDSHEFIAAEFKGSNLKFNQMKIELFKTKTNYLGFNFFKNNIGYYPENWEGFIVESLNNPNFFSYKFYYKGDTIITTRIYLQDNDGNEQIPYFLYFANQGIIGYHIDSNLTYTLQ